MNRTEKAPPSRSLRHGLLSLFLPVWIALVPGCLIAGAFGDTHTVCPSGCDYTTIQAAVSASNPGDTVEVQVIGAHTEGPIEILDDVTIRGLGRTTTFVQQASTLPLANDRVFLIGHGATVTIRDMTVRRGSDPDGGCVYVFDGDLLLLDMDVRECEGGAIFNGSHLTLRGVTVDDSSAALGGGIFNNSAGVIQIEASSIAQNESSIRGGGLYNSGEAILLLTSITQNMSDGNGAGIFNDGTGSLFLESSSVEGNTGTGPFSQGGGIYSEGGLTVRASSVSSNTAFSGGGLSVASFLPAKIIDSTIAGNVAVIGGGIHVLSSFDLINSTVSNNQVFESGGGLFITFGIEARLANVTVTKNTADLDHDNSGNGGGISNTEGEVRLLNSVIAGNIDGSDVFHVNGTDCYGTVTSDTYNLIGSLGRAGINGDPVCEVDGDPTGNTIGIAAELGPLASNGGPTLTHALLDGSPAIDTGDPTGCLSYEGIPIPSDQRGYLRPNRCDRGSYERGALAPLLIFEDGFESGSTAYWTIEVP